MMIIRAEILMLTLKILLRDMKYEIEEKTINKDILNKIIFRQYKLNIYKDLMKKIKQMEIIIKKTKIKIKRKKKKKK